MVSALALRLLTTPLTREDIIELIAVLIVAGIVTICLDIGVQAVFTSARTESVVVKTRFAPDTPIVGVNFLYPLILLDAASYEVKTIESAGMPVVDFKFAYTTASPIGNFALGACRGLPNKLALIVLSVINFVISRDIWKFGT